MHMNRMVSDSDLAETPVTDGDLIAQQAGILPLRHRDRDVTDLSPVICT